MKKSIAIALIIMLLLSCLLTACQEHYSYVIVHYQNGEADKQIKFDADFAFPQSPAREGYVFKGWYKNQDCTGEPWTIPEQLEGYSHMWAKWVPDENPNPQTATVTFDYNYSGKQSENKSVRIGSAIVFPSEPSREGYNFLGWFTDPVNGTKWLENTAVHQSLTLYAHWTQKETPPAPSNTATVIFNLNYEGASSETKTAAKGSSVQFPAEPSRTNYTFEGWFTAPSGGVKWTVDMPVSADTLLLYAHWTAKTATDTHTHDFGNNYFAYVKCSGCNVVGRNESLNTYKNDFKYDFTASKQQEITNRYNSLTQNLNNGNNYSTFISLYNGYSEDLNYVEFQYQVAYVEYCSYAGTTYENNYKTIAAFYNTSYDNYFGLYKKIYDSPYKEDFFYGYSEQEINELLASSSATGGAENQNRLDEITESYGNILKKAEYLEDLSASDLNTLYSLYGEFVSINNANSKAAGYENYMYYAYENEYYREYKPSDVVAMRNLVKTKIAPIFTKIAQQASGFYDNLGYLDLSDQTNENFYEALLSSSVFDSSSTQTVGYVSDYFKYMQSSSAGKKTINFFDHCNDIFKNGNYFAGTQDDGAFTYYIPHLNSSIVYFGENYRDAFTFVHEYGHYYEGVYNGGLSLSMDHDETQSQGNEMMFLAWLGNNLQSGVSDGYQAVRCEQLYNILSSIVMSTAVDEFEQAVYSGSYNGTAIGGDYGDLFTRILATYGDASQYLSSDYWAYVVVDSAAYYISYAMSALPSLELYAKAMTDGLDAARESYFKLFTFSENSSLVETSGSQINVTATYQEILNAAGLRGPFEEQLYTDIEAYFNS